MFIGHCLCGMNLEFVQNWVKSKIIKSPIEFPIRFPIKCPYRIAYEIFHLEIGMRAHLGDSFDEVIGFITTSALPDARIDPSRLPSTDGPSTEQLP